MLEEDDNKAVSEKTGPIFITGWFGCVSLTEIYQFRWFYTGQHAVCLSGWSNAAKNKTTV